MFEKLAELFKATAIKYMKSVDGVKGRSHQHEIGGLVAASFGRHLGTDPEACKYFSTTFVWVDDDCIDPVTEQGTTCWYNARRGKSDIRGPEFRLYYVDNDVTERFDAGQLAFFMLTHDDKLIILSCPHDSLVAEQLLSLFSFDIKKLESGKVKGVDLTKQKLLLPLRSFFKYTLGIPIDLSEHECEKRIEEKFGSKFPSTVEFSDFVQSEIKHEIDLLGDPDGALILLTETEERYFKALEYLNICSRLKTVFSPREYINLSDISRSDVDTLLAEVLSFHNRRKSRAGFSFENHIKFILDANQIRYTLHGKTELKVTPDFLFPGVSEYHNPNFPSNLLRMLAAKTTCKDRWRQVISEANRIPIKHLITLEGNISEPQMEEMRVGGIQLVMPQPIAQIYPDDRHKYFISFKQFIDEVYSLER